MANGVGLSQPPAVLLKTADAITQKYFANILADSIFKPSPFWWRLTRLGKKLAGGGAIVWPVVYAEETPGGAYWGAQLLDNSAVDSVQPAEIQWRFYNQPITIPYTDVLLNAGPTGVLDLIKVKEETAMASLLQKLSRAVWGTAPQNTALDLDPVSTALGSTSSTYAGISRSSNAWWNCNGGSGPTTLSANLSLSAMQTAYGQVTFGNEEPDTIITTQAGFNAYWNLLVGNIRYMRDDETTRAGFKRHLMFNNAVVMHDQFCTSGEMIFINSKYVHPVFHQDDYFVVDPFMRPSNQRILSSYIWVTLQIKWVSPRMHARVTSISNA
ncbi:MAG: phage major capsid protein [candidate division WOR-3 bacterium]